MGTDQEIQKIEDRIEYILKDPNLPELPIRASDVTKQAWWVDRSKVEALLRSLKGGRTVTESLVIIGITWAQYLYFYDKHPEFKEVKNACEQIFNILIKDKICERLDDLQNLHWIAERRMRDQFGNSKSTTENEPIPSNQVFVKDSKVYLTVSDKTARLAEEEFKHDKPAS